MIREIELLISALWEFFVYDVVMLCSGFSGIHRRLARLRAGCRNDRIEAERICMAVSYATSLYFGRVYCLQRSMAAARLLRRHGWDAHLVIGYRPVPFLSHAWVEIGTMVVNDSPEYRRQLQVLERI